jgi:hypothetical protein
MPNSRVAEVSRLLYRNIGHNHKPYSAGMVKRIRKDKTSITTQSVDFKAPHSAKTNQAWRYPGGKVVRAPSTWLGTDHYYDHKDREQKLPRRKQESNFFITINSNKSPTESEHTEKVVGQMEQMLRHISKEEVLATYIKFGPSHESGKNYEKDKYLDVIHSVDWKSAVESGDIMKRVHAHIWCTITHYSQIQINVQMLMHQVRSSYNDGMPEGVLIGKKSHNKTKSYLRMTAMPYVHVKLLPQSDWTSVMRQYIHKGMTSA